MLKEKPCGTVGTELSAACGLFGEEFSGDALAVIDNVDEEAIAKAVAYYKNEKSIVQSINEAGQAIHPELDRFKGIRWSGPDKLGNENTSARDIQVLYDAEHTTGVSVKAKSDVIWNASAARWFDHWANGRINANVRGGNWFALTAPDEYQNLFIACDGPDFTGLNTIFEFDHRKGFKTEKKAFKLHSTNAIQHTQEADYAYRQLTQKTAEVSSKKLNDCFRSLRLDQKPEESFKLLFWEAFRLNTQPYFLCGLERGEKPFAIRMCGKSEWQSRFRVKDVIARPNAAKQAEVYLDFIFEEKLSKVEYCFSLRIEIRWSHGKFSGNPEAKIYKRFDYRELPWVSIIL